MYMMQHFISSLLLNVTFVCFISVFVFVCFACKIVSNYKIKFQGHALKIEIQEGDMKVIEKKTTIDTVTKKRRKRKTKTRTKIEMTIDIEMKKDGTTINMKKNTKIERRIRKRTKMTKDEIKKTEKRKMIGKIEMKRRTETKIRYGLFMTIRCPGVLPL